jgi:acyl-coenzyme A thioesterase PaaI-like protein
MSQNSDRENYANALTQTVISLPIHQTLGLSLVSQSQTPVPTAFLEFTTQQLHLTSARTVHGGITQLAIDAACFLAVIPILSVGQGAIIIASSFRMLNAVPGLGKRYEVEGKVVRRGKAIVFCEGEVMV